MAYDKQTWVDDDGTLTVGTMVTADRMNHIEQGVADAGSSVWRGDFDPEADYDVNDLVFYGGSTFRALEAIAGGANPAPVNDAARWAFVARAGDPGAQGPQGDPGADGAVGINWRGAWNGLIPYEVNDGVTYDGSSFRAIEAVAAPEPPPPLGADTTTVDAPALVDGVDFTESMADRMFYSGTYGTYVFVRVVTAGDVEIALTNNLTGTDTVNANAVVDGVPGSTAAFGATVSDTVALPVGDHWIRIQMTVLGHHADRRHLHDQGHRHHGRARRRQLAARCRRRMGGHRRQGSGRGRRRARRSRAEGRQGRSRRRRPGRTASAAARRRARPRADTRRGTERRGRRRPDRAGPHHRAVRRLGHDARPGDAEPDQARQRRPLHRRRQLRRVRRHSSDRRADHRLDLPEQRAGRPGAHLTGLRATGAPLDRRLHLRPAARRLPRGQGHRGGHGHRRARAGDLRLPRHRRRERPAGTQGRHGRPRRTSRPSRR